MQVLMRHVFIWVVHCTTADIERSVITTIALVVGTGVEELNTAGGNNHLVTIRRDTIILPHYQCQ